MNARFLGLAVCSVMLPLVGLADEVMKSGPAVGEFIPAPFHPLNLTGDRAGSRHCLVCRYGLHPVLAIFAREVPGADQPLAQLLKDYDSAIARYPDAYLGGFVVFLSDAPPAERDTLAAKIVDLGKALELKHVVLCLDGPDGPEGYALHKDATVTVLFYRQHKVVENRVFTKDQPMMGQDVQALMSVVEKLVPKKESMR
ncbi:MAG: hypothetical protein NZ700_15270 [Gemmataceae bacterium]|nr:hypothetical protein [Gemmataceae bacterium]MDW8266183.1 hypothetical protein [Gemmataceae bacterium]